MKKLIIRLAGIVAISMMSLAQTANSAIAPSPAELKWVSVNGNATDLSIGTDGAVFAVDAAEQVWLQREVSSSNKRSRSWIHLPGKFTRIAAAHEKLAWAINADGILYKWQGSWWQSMGTQFPIYATDVAVSANDKAFATTRDGRVVSIDQRKGILDLSSGDDAPRNAIRVDADNQDRPWVITTDGDIFYLQEGQWAKLPNIKARDLSMTGSGDESLWFIGLAGNVIHASLDGSDPQLVGAQASVIATTPNDKPWIATADGALYANDLMEALAPNIKNPMEKAVFTELINWQKVSGKAAELAISSKGAIAALGKQGRVWYWKGKNNWGILPGKFKQISLDKNGTIWGLGNQDRVYRYQGSYWQEIPGQAQQIVAGADGNIWIHYSGELQIWSEQTLKWISKAKLLDEKLRDLAIDLKGLPWIIDGSGQIQRFDSKNWLPVADFEAVSLTASPEGTIFATDNEQQLWRWGGFNKRWALQNGKASSVAAGPNNTPWVIRSNGDVFAAGFFNDSPESKVKTLSLASANAIRASQQTISDISNSDYNPSGGNQAPSSSPNEPLVFQKVTGAPRQLAIGAEGSVFGLNFDSSVLRWNNGRNSFLGFPGQFSRIAVTPDGDPWGINSKGEVFRHDGTDWRVVYNILATDIAISYDGTIMVIGPQNILQKYDEEEGRFARLFSSVENPLPLIGKRLAIDPQGTPWLILEDDFVAHCEKLTCVRTTTRARDIDIGPEGSIFIVDTDRVLRRWNIRGKSFDRISTIAGSIASVSVGPLGKPWLINTKSEVWSSAFFDRDESQDNITNATSTTNTTTNNTPVFTFTTTLQFQTVPYPLGFQFLSALAAGPSGTVIAMHGPFFPATPFLIYDENAKRFIDSVIPTSAPGEIPDGLALGPSDELWAWNNPVAGSVDGHIRVYKNNAWLEIFGVNDMTLASPTPSPPDTRMLDLSISANGDVLVAGPDTGASPNIGSTLYRFNNTINQFVSEVSQFSGDESSIAVDPSGIIWLVSNPTGADTQRRVYQYVNNSFVERPLPAGMTACNQPYTNIPNPLIDGCISAGANGSIFILAAESTTGPAARKLLRWNPSGNQWDKVITSPAFTEIRYVAVASDGRPWLIADPGDATFRVYKAQ